MSNKMNVSVNICNLCSGPCDVGFYCPDCNRALSGMAIELAWDIDEKILAKISKCECGGDKLRLSHSDWCPKYQK
jgi:hypothetical protein